MKATLLTDIWPIHGGTLYAGSEWEVLWRFDTTNGERVALGNGERVVCPACPTELLAMEEA